VDRSRRRFNKKPIAAVAIALAVSTLVFGQMKTNPPAQTIRISGRLLDSDGSPIEGASVAVKLQQPDSTGSLAIQEGVTDRNGRFDFRCAAFKKLDLGLEAGDKRMVPKLIDVKGADVNIGDLNVVALIQTGAPLSVYQNTNNNASIGAGVQRPNLVGNACYSGSPESRQNQYLNPTAFSTAPAFTYGDTPRTIPCLGPGLANWDLAITKDFHLTEKVAFQFRAESLNAFNTPQFSAPVTKFGAVTFGQLQTQANYSRYIELGGRISF